MYLYTLIVEDSTIYDTKAVKIIQALYVLLILKLTFEYKPSSEKKNYVSDLFLKEKLSLLLFYSVC